MDVLTAMEPLALLAKPCPTPTESCRNGSSSDGGDRQAMLQRALLNSL